MCNACGNVCCGSDQFVGCGCDDCEEEDCWSDDDDFADLDEDDMPDDYGEWPESNCCARPTRRFVCE